MFKYSLRAAGLVASLVAFSTGAWAATATISQTATTTTFANELFGPGSDAVVLQATPTTTPLNSSVILTVSTLGVDAGNAADVTITLENNAVFASAVGLGTFTYTPTGGGAVTSSRTGGGNAGDNFVTFNVLVNAALDIGDTFTFAIPSFTQADVLASPTGVINARATMTATTTSGTNTFPDLVTVPSPCGGDCVVANAAFGLDPFEVDSDDNDAVVELLTRTIITMGDFTSISTGPTTSVNSLQIGRFDVDDEAAQQSDGDDFEDDPLSNPNGQGIGTMDIVVNGPFNPGDIVLVDLDGGSDVDVGESLTISGNSATGSFTIANIDDNEPLVYYVPAGGGNLFPATFSMTMTTVFGVATNANRTASGSSTISFAGVDPTANIPAIPPSTAPDIGNIRLRCDSSAPCQTFLSCNDQAGVNYFGEVGMIPGNGVTVLQNGGGNSGVEDIVGSGWTGRAFCTMFVNDTANGGAQILTRAGGNPLVSNSFESTSTD